MGPVSTPINSRTISPSNNAMSIAVIPNMILKMPLLAAGFNRIGETGLAAATARGSFIMGIVLSENRFRLHAGEVCLFDRYRRFTKSPLTRIYCGRVYTDRVFSASFMVVD